METMLIFILFLISIAILAGWQWGKYTVWEDVLKQDNWQLEKFELNLLRKLWQSYSQ